MASTCGPSASAGTPGVCSTSPRALPSTASGTCTWPTRAGVTCRSSTRRARCSSSSAAAGPIPGMLKNPTAIAIDRKDRIYVGDYLNHRVEVYRLINTTAEDSFLDPVAQTKGGGLQDRNRRRARSRKARKIEKPMFNGGEKSE